MEMLNIKELSISTYAFTLKEVQSRYRLPSTFTKVPDNKSILFEEVSNINKPAAKMVSWKTNPERLPAWIAALEKRYEKDLGAVDAYIIKWKDHRILDSPKDLIQLECTFIDQKLFTLSVHLTTGCITCQGAQYLEFAKQEFNKLKTFLNQLCTKFIPEHSENVAEGDDKIKDHETENDDLYVIEEESLVCSNDNMEGAKTNDNMEGAKTKVKNTEKVEIITVETKNCDDKSETINTQIEALCKGLSGLQSRYCILQTELSKIKTENKKFGNQQNTIEENKITCKCEEVRKGNNLRIEALKPELVNKLRSVVEKTIACKCEDVRKDTNLNIETLKTENKKMEVKMNSLQLKLTTLEKQNEKLENRLHTYNHDEGKSRQEKSDLQQENSRLRVEITNLKSVIDIKEAENSKLSSLINSKNLIIGN